MTRYDEHSIYQQQRLLQVITLHMMNHASLAPAPSPTLKGPQRLNFQQLILF